MSSEQNKARVRQFFADSDAAQAMTGLDDITTEDFVSHFPGMPQLDREGLKQVAAGFYSALGPLRHELVDLIAEGDIVASRLIVRGTHNRPFVTPMGEIPPSGNAVTLTALNMFRFRDARLAEHIVEMDSMSLMQQLGAMPAPAGATAG